MNRKRNFMFFALVWAVGLTFILLEGNLVSQFLFWTGGLDLTIILTAYIYLHSSSRHAGIFAFVQGLFLDIYSSGFEGLFVFLYLCSLATISVCSKFIHLSNPRGQVFVVGITWLMEKALFLAMVAALGADMDIKGGISSTALIPMLITAMLTPIIFYFLDRLHVLVGGNATRDTVTYA